MNQTFRLKEGTARSVVIRNLKPMGAILVVAGFFNLGFIYMSIGKTMGFADYRWLYLMTLVFYFGVLCLIWFIISGFLIMANENLVITTNDQGITRAIDLGR